MTTAKKASVKPTKVQVVMLSASPTVPIGAVVEVEQATSERLIRQGHARLVQSKVAADE